MCAGQQFGRASSHPPPDPEAVISLALNSFAFKGASVLLNESTEQMFYIFMITKISVGEVKFKWKYAY